MQISEVREVWDGVTKVNELLAAGWVLIATHQYHEEGIIGAQVFYIMGRPAKQTAQAGMGVFRLAAVKQLRNITGCTLLQAGEAVDKTTNFEDAITFIQTRGQA
jgi:ribosomal protein L7/L12